MSTEPQGEDFSAIEVAIAEANENDSGMSSNARVCKRKMKGLKFVHITKTAGTSIEVASNGSWGKFDNDLQTAARKKFATFWDIMHIPLRYFDPKDLEKILEENDLFTVVRNPFDRVVSEYYCNWGGPRNKSNDKAEFNRYITDKLKDVLELTSQGEMVHGHFTPMHTYLMDSTGRNIVPLENVVHFERLNEEFSELMSRYSLTVDLARTGVHNASAHEKKFSVRDLSPVNVRLIQRVYKTDFELFGYDRNPSVTAVLSIKPAETDSRSQASTSANPEPGKKQKSQPSPSESKDWEEPLDGDVSVPNIN